MKTTGKRRRFLEGQVGRDAAHVAAARQRLSGEAEYREAEDAIARRDVRYPRADCFDDAADFVAEDSRVRRFAGIKRQRLEHVAEIHARRFHFDQHLTRPAGRQRKRREAQRVEMAALAGFQAQRHRRVEPLLAGRTTAIEALYVASFASQGDLALGVFAQQVRSRAMRQHRKLPAADRSRGRRDWNVR